MREIDNYAQTMAASHALARPLDAFAKRLIRAEEDAAKEVYDRLRSRQHTTGPVHAELYWKDSLLARGIRYAIEEFKKRHPRYAKEIDDIIATQRRVRRNYVSFKSSDPLYEICHEILEKAGIPEDAIENTHKTIMDMADYLKAQKQPVKILME